MEKRISIYTDEGASHSFIWLIKLFEKYNIFSVSFVSSKDIGNGILDASDILIVSGGDSFAVAESLGEEGARAISDFISKGGIYAGICAGAYLVLRSSKKPLHHFNFTSGKINNLSSSLPKAKAMEYKYSTSYGCSYIFHPVRGEINMEILSGGTNMEDNKLLSPIYGGPLIKDDKSITPLALFNGFTGKTMFLVNEKLAEETCNGAILAGKRNLNRGMIFFFSTHMEHPDYPAANELFLEYLFGRRISSKVDYNGKKSKRSSGRIGNKDYYEFRKNIREMRLLSIGIENRQIYWQIGKKAWETEKVRAFTESLFEMDKKYGLILDEKLSDSDISLLKSSSLDTLTLLRQINKLLSEDKPSQSHAEDYFRKVRTLLSIYASFCFKYFKQMSKQST